MEDLQVAQQAEVDRVYNHAANLLIHQKKTEPEVVESLRLIGLDEPSATIVVQNLSEQITAARKKRARKDMLYGALWCIGGIVLTAAHIGFIFWGAIVFGAIQFFKGVANAA